MPLTALDSVKVLDLSNYISGAYCTKLLADFGADVIKVEPPGGDPSRTMGPFFQDDPHPEKSFLFLHLNTNKRSITLNLKTVLGKKIVKRLAEWADIVVENFRPGEMASMGLGYDELSSLNPGLVMVSITPFGQDGPYRDYKGGDIVEYALGGFMYCFGEYDREPLMHGGYQAQHTAGANGAIAGLVALYHQRVTGEGQHIDVSSVECQASILRDTTSQYSFMGAIRRRRPKERLAGVATTTVGGGSRVMQVKDGYFMGEIGVSRGGSDWEGFVNLLGADELKDPKFATEEGRRVHNEEMMDVVNRVLMRRGRDELLAEAQRNRYMWGPVLDPADVVNSPQLAARNFFTTIDRAYTGPIKYPGEPFKMTDTPWAIRRPAPTLGEHNREIYCTMLGYSREDLVRLRQLNVI